MATVANDTAQIRVQGFERITRLEVQMSQFMTRDIPDLHKDVADLKRTLSPRNFMLYAGGVGTLVVSLAEIARTLRIIP